MMKRIRGTMLYRFLRSVVLRIVHCLVYIKQVFGKKFCKKRDSAEEFNEYLKEHGIVTVLPRRYNIVEQGQIEYLNLNKEENTKSYYHRMIETNIGLLHFVTGGNGEMKIITDWFYKQCRVQHSLNEFNEIAKRCMEMQERLAHNQQELAQKQKESFQKLGEISLGQKELEKKIEESRLKSERNLAEQYQQVRELYDRVMDLRRQMDEKKSGENRQIEYNNNSYTGYIRQ